VKGKGLTIIVCEYYHEEIRVLHTLKYANIDLETEVIGLPDKKKKVEGAAERTGEAVGEGLKKSAKAVEDFGKGIKKRIEKKE
jgi:hypothetical protein